MNLIRTVLGDIAASSIGSVMFHEHILFNIVPPGSSGSLDANIKPLDRWQINYRSNEYPGNALQQDVDVAAAELRAFAQEGGSLIVDQSTFGLARDPNGLARAAQVSGVAIVATAGTYTAAYLDAHTTAMDVIALSQRFIDEVNIGLNGTDIRAGLIGEIGCSWPLVPIEQRALEAAAIAQRSTGAAISVHPGRHEDACGQILDILESAGADLQRVILCHMDRTYPDGDNLEPLLDRGANVEWDFFGVEQSYYWMDDSNPAPQTPTQLPIDLDRLRFIKRYADAGYADQILVSQDICTRTRLRHWGGHGYGHILRNVKPLMQRLGFTEAFINTLLHKTPVRLLTLTEIST